MNRTISIASLALFASACQPWPEAGLPPGGPIPPAAEGCAVTSSANWRAWIDLTPGPDNRPTLFVTGNVSVPTAGFRLEFDPFLIESRSYPVQLTATLRAIPPGGPAAQVVTPSNVRWQWPLRSGPVGSVTIRCGDRALATISPVPEVQ